MSKKEESQDATPVIKDEEPPFDHEGQVTPMGFVLGQFETDPLSMGDFGGLEEFAQAQRQARISARFDAIGELAERAGEAAKRLLDRMEGKDHVDPGDLHECMAVISNSRAQLRNLLDGLFEDMGKRIPDGA